MFPAGNISIFNNKYLVACNFLDEINDNTTDLHNDLYLTNRFHVAVHLSSNRSQMTSKCGKNKKVFLPHFDVLCDLLLDRCTTTWNLFVLYNKELNFVRIKAALFHVRRAKVGPSPF